MTVADGVRRARTVIAPTAHRTIDRLRRPVGRRLFQEAYEDARKGGAVRVNIGSGRKPVPGWINTDVAWQGRIYLDATQRWPVPDGSVDLVYADNVIEHFTLEDGRKVFVHAFAALKPGGVFRLATPDVEAVARQYLENGELARAGMDRNAECGHPMLHPVELLTRVYVGAQHYLGFIYDYQSLSAEMEAVGFVVRRVPAGTSEHPDLCGVEARMHPAEEATALIVEGRKPVS
jgi:predicted SAM-dependent methyltransferase